MTVHTPTSMPVRAYSRPRQVLAPERVAVERARDTSRDEAKCQKTTRNSIPARTLPPRLLAELRRHAAGRVIYIPVGERRPRNAARDRAIRRARRAGASIPALARHHSLSESRVWEICHGLHPDRRFPRRYPTQPQPRKESVK